jgi:hypothetical protein
MTLPLHGLVHHLKSEDQSQALPNKPSSTRNQTSSQPKQKELLIADNITEWESK